MLDKVWLLADLFFNILYPQHGAESIPESLCVKLPMPDSEQRAVEGKDEAFNKIQEHM